MGFLLNRMLLVTIGSFLILAGAGVQTSATTIHGTIIDSATGLGIANVQVYAYGISRTVYPGGSTIPQYSLLGIDSTDASGAYSITGTIYFLDDGVISPLYPPTNELVVTVTAEKYGTPAAERRWNLPVPDDVTASFTIKRAVYGQNDVSIQGYVLDKQSGAPVTGASVELIKMVYRSTGGYSWTELTPVNYWIVASDGKFAFTLDPNQKIDGCRLIADKPGYSTADTMVFRPTGGTLSFPYNFTLRLERAFATIKGTVSDSLTKAPLSATKVYLRELVYSTLNPDSCLGYYRRDSAITGSSGAYLFDSIKVNKKYNVVAVHAGYAVDSVIVNAAENGTANPVFTADIDLRSSLASLTGVLSNLLTGRPVKSASVYLMGDVFVKVGPYWLRHDTIYDSSLTDANGRYLIDSIADTLAYSISSRAAAYYDWNYIDIAFQGGTRQVLDLPMIMRTGFQGNVTDSITHAAVPNAKVVLTHSIEIPGIPPRFITFTDDSMRTDSKGYYALPVSFSEYQSIRFTLTVNSTGYPSKNVAGAALAESTVVTIPFELFSGITSAGSMSLKQHMPEMHMVKNMAVFTVPEPSTVRIYSVSGRLLTQKTFTGKWTADLSRWSSSLFIFDIRDNKGSRVRVMTGISTGM